MIELDLPDLLELPELDEEPKWTYRPYQTECFRALDKGWQEYNRLLIELATGCGKCLGKGTPVLMFDGRIKPVEEVRKGDLLMGPDSKPRRVLSTCRGRERLYRITPTKGTPYVVNESHILSLKITGGRNRNVTVRDEWKAKGGDVVNIGVADYLATSRSFKHVAKGWRAPVSFRDRRLPKSLPPYILGVWLGDGTRVHTSFACEDQEVISELNWFAISLGLCLREENDEGRCRMWVVTSKKKTGRGKSMNIFKTALRRYGLDRRKHVPHLYKANARWVRLEVLAGLLDTDGSLTKGNTYDFVSKSRQLAEDLCFLARSVGLAAYMSPCKKTCVNNGKTGSYFRVCISGDISIIPCRIARKKATPRRQKKDVLVTGIKVEPIGEGDYYGFEITGDRLFLLGDFTVTHNTVIFTKTARDTVAKGGRVLILAHTDELLDQAVKKLKNSTGLEAAKEKASDRAALTDSIVVASVQTLRGERLLSWPEKHFDLVIIDECHRTMSKGYLNIIEHFVTNGGARLLGVTATPDRGDKKNLMEVYEHVAFRYTLLDAVRDGWLVPPVAKTIPLEIDLRNAKKSRSPNGSDYRAEDVAHAIEPFLEEIAQKVWECAHDRKIVVFMPSVDTADQMAAALRMAGFDADFVSGMCPDRHEKIARFSGKGRGSAIVCAMLLTEGWDQDDVDCVVFLRATTIRALYVQGNGRATRPLDEIVPALNAAKTAEERRAIIAASAKPNFLMLDFLWLTEKLDLVHPAHFVARTPEVAEKMVKEKIEGDLIKAEAETERDLLEALEKAVRKNAKKKGRTIDPLAFAVGVGDVEMADYEPESRFDRMPPTEGQLTMLKENGFDVSKVKYRGHAAKLIEIIHKRAKAGLCSAKQMSFLQKRGMAADALVLLPAEDAQKMVVSHLMNFKRKRKRYGSD